MAMKNGISQDDFARIVTEVLESDADVREFTIKEKGVSLSICAAMRREKANAFLDFDDHGTISGRFSHAQTDANAQKPREIGARISSEIRKMLQP